MQSLTATGQQHNSDQGEEQVHYNSWPEYTLYCDRIFGRVDIVGMYLPRYKNGVHRPVKSKKPDPGKAERGLAEQRRYMAERAKGYREQALKLYPWICGRCAREFTRANLSELTVHHINHDHDYNPTDGSNWELLCLYCHDEEHSKFENFIRYGRSSETKRRSATHNPFAGLKDAIDNKKD